MFLVLYFSYKMPPVIIGDLAFAVIEQNYLFHRYGDDAAGEYVKDAWNIGVKNCRHDESDRSG